MLAIAIPWDPNLFEIGGFRFTWHSLCAVIGILVGVYVARWMGRRTTIDDDKVTTLALWAVAGGIVMARFLYVIDNLDQFGGNIGRVFALNEGGITVWGAPIGGAIAVSIASWWMRLPVRTALDIGSPGLILGMSIGRLGDLINGEHLATASDLPWAVFYTNPATLGQGFPVHPATTYELLGDVIIFGVLLLLASRVMGRGYMFWTMLGSYAALRFGLQFLRLDQLPHFLGLQQSQIIGVLAMLATAGWIAWDFVRRSRPSEPAEPGGRLRNRKAKGGSRA